MFVPDQAVAPGVNLEAWRKANQYSVKEAADRCLVTVDQFAAIVDGEQRIDSNLANRLRYGTHIAADCWLTMKAAP